MLRYIILVSLCWAVFYLLYHFWLKRETFFAVNRWYLLGALLLGLGIPLVELPALAGPAPEPLSFVYQAPVIIGADWLEVTVRPRPANTSGLSIVAALKWVYWLGVAIALFRLLYGLGQIYSLYRSAEVFAQPGFVLVRTNRPHLPFSFFHLLFQSREIYFPEEEQQQIYHHELAHINGRHSIDVLLIELTGILLWCSPMIYLYRRSLRDVHEFLADAAVLKTTRRKAYSKLLLRQFQSGLQLALANHFIRSQFKNRINMMTKKRSGNRALLKYLLVLPVLTASVFLFAKRTALAEELNWAGKPAAEIAQPAVDTIPASAEVMPRYPGCEELKTEAERQACAHKQFMTFLLKDIRYPAEARKAGIQGTVIVRFTINENGQAQDPEILKSPGGGLGEEVLRLVAQMPPWIPGRNQDKPVAVRMTLPVQFTLEEQRRVAEPVAEQFEVMPVFAGCEGLTDPEQVKQCTATKLSQFMASHIQYPAEARELGIKGKVLVQMTIDETGKVVAVEIDRGVDRRLDEEAIRVVRSLPAWQPAQKEGKAVKAQLTIPILFDLPVEHQAVVIGYAAGKEADSAPRFPGCEGQADEQARIDCAQKQFMAYVFNTIKYPKEAKDAKVEGLVVASFEVDTNGRIGAVKILRPLGHGTDEEVERVLLSMNELPERWTPARQDGKIVKAQMTLPVKFALPKEEDRDLAKVDIRGFRLSPNPNQGQFELVFQAEARPTLIRVTDSAGRLIREENLPSFSGRYQGVLDLEQKSPGAYFLSISQEGKGVFNHTFIVQ